MNSAAIATHQDAVNPRLEPMLIRLPPTLCDRLRRLARATRGPAVRLPARGRSDLLSKYEHLELGAGSNEPQELMR